MLRFLGRTRLGHRGGVLLLLALIDFGYGLSLVAPNAELLATASAVWRQHYAPTWAWGLAWIMVGMVLLLYAFRRHDAVGYATAIAWKVAWALMTLASWAFGGVDRGWVATLIWLTFVGIVAIAADWPEPSRFPSGSEITLPIVPRPPDEED